MVVFADAGDLMVWTVQSLKRKMKKTLTQRINAESNLEAIWLNSVFVLGFLDLRQPFVTRISKFVKQTPN